MISVENLCKSFGDLEILKGITENIEKGEKVVIIGPSGSGKSTFLRCLNLLEKPTSGSIIFEGTDITHSSEKELNLMRQKMGMVFQHFNLFANLSIINNITLAPVKLKLMTKEEAEAKAEGLLKKVGLLDKAYNYPSQLSGGQKQRIAIARSLAMNPDVMLFDEPTSALDPISTIKIEELATELKKNYTIVIVTHNMQQATRISDKTAFFLHGEIVEFDETQRIFSNPKEQKTLEYITGRFG